MRRPVAALAVALLLAACGGDGDEAATTTTTEAPTTTTTGARSDEELIRSLVDGYRTMHERYGNPVDPSSPVVDRLLVDPIRGRAIGILTEMAPRGGYYTGTYALEVLRIEFEPGGEAATVYTCGQDRITKHRGDGSIELAPDDEAVEVDFEVVRTAAGWRIAESTTFEDEPCSLG